MAKRKMLGEMLTIAANAHYGQFDRGGRPYYLHVLKVMEYVNSDDEELQCIAIGHDLFEDTNVTEEELREAGISERVIQGITALTKQHGQTLDEYKEGVFGNRDAMMVKLADLQHNSDITRLKGITDRDFERMRKYHQFYLEIKERLNEQ